MMPLRRAFLEKRWRAGRPAVLDGTRGPGGVSPTEGLRSGPYTQRSHGATAAAEAERATARNPWDVEAWCALRVRR